MSDPLEQARRQLKSELRELGFWPTREQTEPFLEDEARRDIRERITSALEDLDPAELIVVRRVVETLASG